MNCVSCHQFPAPEVRAYAKLIHDTPHADAADAGRQSSRRWINVTLS